MARERYESVRRSDWNIMPLATAEAIVAVFEGLLKTRQQYIPELCYITSALSNVTTTKGTASFHKDVMEALNKCSQYSSGLGMVAEIYSGAAN